MICMLWVSGTFQRLLAGLRSGRPVCVGATTKLVRVLFLMAMIPAAVLNVPAHAQGRPCAVIVDRTKFVLTIEKARTALARGEISGTAEPYREGTDVEAFAKIVADLRPSLIVAHYSMFAPGQSYRGKILSEFLAALEATKAPPLHYAIYSSSFRDEIRHPRGLTLNGLRGKGYFQSIPDQRITLIYVPDGSRFTKGNGDSQLLAAARKVCPGT